MALQRQIELSVGADGTGLLISDLDVSFEVIRSVTFAENTAGFTITNAQESTRREILKQGNNVIFKAGYEDEGIGVLFIGNISMASSVRSGPDIITTLECVSVRGKDKPLGTTYVSLSYGPDVSIKKPLQDIAAALGLVLMGADNTAEIALGNINLDGGFTAAGTARAALDYCKNILKANDVGLYIDNTELVVYNLRGRTSRFTPVYLDYESGLITVQEIEEEDNQSAQDPIPKKVEFDCLINPKLQPNGLVQIKTPHVNGFFIIDKLTFSGDNFGGDFHCVGEAVE